MVLQLEQVRCAGCGELWCRAEGAWGSRCPGCGGGSEGETLTVEKLLGEYLLAARTARTRAELDRQYRVWRARQW